MKRFFVMLLIVFVLAGLFGCSGAVKSSIQVETPWIRTAASGNNTAAFMVIKNSTALEDKLVKAEANISGKVILMDTQKKDGKMQMVDVDSISLPANGQVELKSGSLHIMFMGLSKDLNEGDTVQLNLTFEKGGSLQLSVPVKKPVVSE
jgi:copper(I)-binding protein